MDLMTLIGLVGGISFMLWGMGDVANWQVFINRHGIVLVTGCTFFALMINSSVTEIKNALKAAFSLFKTPKIISPDQVIPIMVGMATKARQLGTLALESESAKDDGFLSRALEACMSNPEITAARAALERELNQVRLRHREVGNIFRTAALLSPMFGLLGTLVGIIQVLKNIAEPESVGPAMALAVSSAFYGILLANLIFVPAAGKLRSRSVEEIVSKEMIVEGLLDIFFTARMPLLIEARLLSYLQPRDHPKEEWGKPSPLPAEAQ